MDKDMRVTPEFLMRVAQDMVDDWRADANRPSFSQYLATHDPSRCPWPCLDLDRHERRNFMILAEAIRTGRGHAYSNPQPLLELVSTASSRELVAR